MNGKLMQAAIAILAMNSLLVSPALAQAQQDQTTANPAQPVVQGPPPPPAPRKLDLGADYAKGPRWFPDIAAPYRQTHIPDPILTNSPRIDQLIQNGKLMLSLEDAVSLALENNMDIAVQRFTPLLDEVNLLRSKSGANGRISFDPTLTSTLSLAETNTPVNNPILSGIGGGGGNTTGRVNVVEAHSAIGNFQYAQNFHTGTQVLVTFNNQRATTSTGNVQFNPALTSSLITQITQPLLNGFGRLPNIRFILEAKNTIKIGVSQLSQQVITTVTQVSNEYWELVFARENVKVAQAALAVDQRLYDDNKKQLDIGTMAPLDVLTAESQLATDQQLLVQAQSVQLQDETNLLVAITKNALVPSLQMIEIVPTTPIFTPDPVSTPLQDAVNEAWKKRPELQQADLNLKNADIEIRATRNALLPSLNVFGLYQSNGLGGNQTVTPVGGVPTFMPGGIFDDWSRLFRSKYPVLQAGINLTLPIRNRAAQAANAQALLTQRQEETQYRQTQNTILLAVRNALIVLNQDRTSVAAAEKARMLAAQTLDDEQKKYQLGASTSYQVVLRSRDLTQAQGVELRDRINLIEAEVSFNQAMGRTLEVNRIDIPAANP